MSDKLSLHEVSLMSHQYDYSLLDFCTFLCQSNIYKSRSNIKDLRHKTKDSIEDYTFVLFRI